MPSKIHRVLFIELKLAYYLLKWVFQQDKRTEGDFTYHRKSAAMALTFILLFVTPAAILLLSFILSLEWLTWLLSISALYALYWTVGLYASMVALPHKIDSSAFLIRYGVLAAATIPYPEIESVELSFDGIGQSGDGLKFDSDEPIAYFSVGSTTRIKITLREPITLELWGKPTSAVSTIFINADRPDQLVESLQERLTTLQS